MSHKRATLDLSLNHVQMEKKNQHEIYARKVRERDRDLKNLKKTELQFRVATENLTHTQVLCFHSILFVRKINFSIKLV